MNRAWMCVAAVAGSLTASAWIAEPAVAQQEERPPVSWVNPTLAGGPRLTHRVLKSAAMGHEVGFVVHLPESYEREPDRRYPVIYFLHGMGGNEARDAPGFSHQVARTVEAGTMPPCLVVFPNGGRSGYRGSVEQMIITELIPLIDAEYRTVPQARAVAGFSMGGAGAVRLTLAHPHLFRAAASWGGGLGRGGGSAAVADAEASIDALKAAGVSFLFVNGDRDRPDAFVPLAERFAARGIHHQREVLPDTGHNLGHYYARSGETMMAFLAAALSQPATP